MLYEVITAATPKLNDLRTLGIDIVWLMPIYPRGGSINSPYAATDYQAVNPSYGTISDLKTFVSKAHNLGMKVCRITSYNVCYTKLLRSYYQATSPTDISNPVLTMKENTSNADRIYLLGNADVKLNILTNEKHNLA